MFENVSVSISYGVLGPLCSFTEKKISIYFPEVMCPYMYVHVLEQMNRKQVEWDQTPKTSHGRRCA